MTLDYAVVDISRCFAPGQAYVALSRCRRPEDMQICVASREALRKALMVDQAVLDFYRKFDKQLNERESQRRMKEELTVKMEPGLKAEECVKIEADEHETFIKKEDVDAADIKVEDTSYLYLDDIKPEFEEEMRTMFEAAFSSMEQEGNVEDDGGDTTSKSSSGVLEEENPPSILAGSHDSRNSSDAETDYGDIDFEMFSLPSDL